jgi:hypothetical protein
MTLGQSMLVIGAITLLGILVLNANSTILQSNTTMDTSEFGITAVSLATSLVEEAMGKMFDQVIADSNTGTITSESQLTPVGNLGPDVSEAYRNGTRDFNDFDDFNNIFLVYKSNVAADTVHTPGSTWEAIVPGIRAKYFVKARVYYVDYLHLDDTSNVRTYHKKIVVTVTSTGSPDTLRFPAIMSYWN